MARVLVVGGMAAGATAAQFARKTDRRAEVVLVSDESHPIHSRCGLPYVLSGRIATFEDLVEFGPDWFLKFRIDLRLRTEVLSVDAASRTAVARSLDGGPEMTLKYDRLVLATGARPNLPPIEGLLAGAASLQGPGREAPREHAPPKLKEGVNVLRSMEDGKRISALAQRGAHAVVIGAGLIGMEVAEALTQRGARVTIVEILPEILLASLDEDMAQAARELVERHGVPMYTCHRAVRISGEERAEGVVIDDLDAGDRRELPADVVVVSTGTRGNTRLAEMAGCKLGTTRQIKVNSRCETSVKGIWAAGDCTECVDLVTGLPVAVGMGTVATRQGRTAGINAAGGSSELPPGMLNTRVTEAFGMKMAGVGPTAAQLRKAGIEPVEGKYTGSTLPEYIPGGQRLVVKVLVHPENGKLLGAQVVGTDQVHQRINAFATALLAGMTAEEFSKLETAYAPPIAPTLDAITLACDVALMRLQRK